MRRERSIPPEYFETLYRDRGDPWAFETSAYEAAKYAHSLRALTRARYGSALEIGCSIGVFTAALASRCDRLTGVDVSATALARAAERLREQPHVELLRRRIPDERVDGRFDLIVLSEVAYYFEADDLHRLADHLADGLAPGGELLLVHWTGETDYPSTADEAVSALQARLAPLVDVVLAERRPEYRLDLWRRSGGQLQSAP